MSTYLLINILIIFFPLILSFENKIKYYKNLKSLLISILITAIIFISWDIWAAYFGHWSFSTDHTYRLRFINLPLEEILFFITVPYSCIFIFECIKYFIPSKKIYYNNYLYYAISILLIIFSILNAKYDYTMIVLFITGITILLINIFKPEVLKDRNYWYYNLISLIPFLVVNHFLTSIPIISYNSDVIWNLRFNTIPVEDFIYSYSLLSIALFIYIIVKNLYKNSEF